MMNARRRMLSMMKTDVRDLVFQFTGQYTDEYVTIDGNLYRVLGFLTDGTLTLDQDMVGDIPFDAWVVAGGGKGSAGSGASSSYRVTDFISLGSSGTLHHPVNCGGTEARIYYDGSNGKKGGNGGWNQLLDYTPLHQILSINSGAGYNEIAEDGTTIVSADAGGNASSSSAGTDKSRTGAKWFDLHSGNDGSGGSGGSGGTRHWCNCGYDQSLHAGDGAYGANGIVYIRILVEE